MLPREPTHLLLELSDDRRIGQTLQEQRHRPLIVPLPTGTRRWAAGQARGIPMDLLLPTQLPHLGELVGRKQHQGLIARIGYLPPQRRLPLRITRNLIVIAHGQDQPRYVEPSQLTRRTAARRRCRMSLR